MLIRKAVGQVAQSKSVPGVRYSSVPRTNTEG